MKIATIVLRILFGALFLFASASFFLQLAPSPPMKGDMKTFMDGVMASGYLMNFIKITELICAIAIISGFFVPLALAVLMPVTLNILLVHLFLEPEGALMGIVILLVHLFLMYSYRSAYQPLLRPRS